MWITWFSKSPKISQIHCYHCPISNVDKYWKWMRPPNRPPLAPYYFRWAFETLATTVSQVITFDLWNHQNTRFCQKVIMVKWSYFSILSALKHSHINHPRGYTFALWIEKNNQHCLVDDWAFLTLSQSQGIPIPSSNLWIIFIPNWHLLLKTPLFS